MAVWPVTLPDIPLIDGFIEDAPNLVVRTQMDAGPAKVRKRFTAGVRPVQGRVACTKAQVATLDAFFVSTCAGGALPFDWTHPRTAAAVSFRFTAPPRYRPDHKDLWFVDLMLEVLP